MDDEDTVVVDEGKQYSDDFEPDNEDVNEVIMGMVQEGPGDD